MFKLGLSSVLAVILAFPLQAEIKGSKKNLSDGLKAFEKKSYGDALIDFKEATIEDPTNAKAFFYLGRCYKETGNMYLASKYVTEAIRLDPANAQFTAYAEILKEITLAPKAAVPNSKPQKIFVPERKRINTTFMTLGIIALDLALVFIQVPTSPQVMTENERANWRMVGLVAGGASLLCFLNAKKQFRLIGRMKTVR